jgi:hypothetical protein
MLLNMKPLQALFLTITTTFLLSTLLCARQTDPQDVAGKWNITVEMPDGEYPSWLEINKSGFNTLTGFYVGIEGSSRPVSEIRYSGADGLFSFSIPPQWESLEDDLYFEFSHDRDSLRGISVQDGDSISWTAVRAPGLRRDEPPVWGEPVNLLDDDFTMWVLPENNLFRMRDGILVNTGVGGNLVSSGKFDDFRLEAEFRYPEGSNSGIYLRGRYEVQIIDSYGQNPDNISLGSVYGFLEPSVNAALKHDEWQTMEITLAGRHITVVLNGIEIICNRPIPGTTGGAIDSNEALPGPVMIQGDHGPVEFRKFIITPSSN